MGWLDRIGGRKQSVTIEQFLAETDDQIDFVLKRAKGAVPYKNAKELRKAAKKDRRAVMGEKGLGALLAGLGDLKTARGKSTGRRGQGTTNYHNIPLKDRMHPAAYKALLDKEARRQGLL
jgi:hypothetical protein